MEIQGQKQDFVAQTHIHLLVLRFQGARVHLGKNFYFCKGRYIYQCPLQS